MPKMRPLGDEEPEMNPEKHRSRFPEGNWQHLPRKFVLVVRFETLDALKFVFF